MQLINCLTDRSGHACLASHIVMGIACMRASLLDRAVRATASTSMMKILLPTSGSKKDIIFCSATGLFGTRLPLPLAPLAGL